MKSTGLARSPAARTSEFHAVEIVAGASCCDAAKAAAGRRHLSRKNPPRLPLPDCTRPDQCRCRFVHHDDRRADNRRSPVSSVSHILLENLPDRKAGQVRRNGGRRKTD